MTPKPALTEVCGEIVAFSKPTETKTSADVAKPSADRKPVGGTGDGISRRASGKWEAVAGLDPNTGRLRRKGGFVNKADAVRWRAKVLSGDETRDLSPAEKIAAAMAHDRLIAAAKPSTPEDRAEVAHYLTFAADAVATLVLAGREPGIVAVAVAEYLLRHPAVSPVTLGRWYQTWLQNMKDANCRARTISSARHSVLPLIKAAGTEPLDQITRDHLATYLHTPVRDRKTREFKAPSPQTRLNRIVCVTTMFRAAADAGHLPKDYTLLPTHGLVRPVTTTLDDDEDDLANIYTIDEAQRLLDMAWETEDTFACTTYVACGLFGAVRNCELLRLRVGPDGINLERGLIRIGRGVAKKRRVRNIVMTENLLTILRAVQTRPQRMRPAEHLPACP